MRAKWYAIFKAVAEVAKTVNIGHDQISRQQYIFSVENRALIFVLEAYDGLCFTNNR